MKTEVDLVLDVLRDAIENDKVETVGREIEVKLDCIDNSFELVEPILFFIENHPYVDFGSPGPLIRIVETFIGRGYEQLLIQSLYRKPTGYTVWMLNRLINYSGDEEKNKYLQILDEIIASPHVKKPIASLAIDFKKFQTDRC